ncbi:MAG: hypothetical protein EOP35_11245 [Rubrivivax sp.]|nr:MAG: hypothetical protein EOP35_11245 [Rubrivivax sp.]
MSDLGAPHDQTMSATNDRPLLATLTRWWSPASTTPEADAMLGYESAHPWALADEAAEHGAVRY